MVRSLMPLFVVVPVLFCACDKQTVTTLDCTTVDFSPNIRHILRIQPNTKVTEDLTFTPERTGTAEVTDAGYVLRFKVEPTGHELRFKINRFTHDGTRELIEASGKRVEGHGGFDTISCKPYEVKRL